TNGIIALIFGTRWLATLAGLAFFSHQVGGFLGVWLGGIVFVRTGSYDAVWGLSVLFGVLSAVVHLPIVEKPVGRGGAVPGGRRGPGREGGQAKGGTGGGAAGSRLSSVVRPPASWRMPAVILACGCLIALIGFGARSGLGFFLTPMSSAHGWGRDVFALALA